MKDMEQKLLENQLNETKQENVTAKLQVLKAREDILSNFVELMEMELQCAICNELFIKVGHTVGQKTLIRYMDFVRQDHKKKKKNES